MGKFKDFDIRLQSAKQVVASLLMQHGLESERMDVVGSSYIVDRTDSDIDVLVLLKSAPYTSGGGFEQLFFPGWDFGGSVSVASYHFGSWKRQTLEAGEVNMLLTCNEDYFNAWLTSAEVCRYLHLRGIVIPRDERIAIHSIIRDDSTAEYEMQRVISR